jgi:hypothetical protein
VDLVKAPGPHYNKRLHRIRSVEVAAVLAPVDFRQRGPVVRTLDCPALQMTVIRTTVEYPDRAVRGLDPEHLEVSANPLVRFAIRHEIPIVPTVDGIPRGDSQNFA